MSYKQQTDKLIGHIKILLRRMAEYSHDFTIHGCIDQYYYIQKLEEFKLINETDLNSRLSHEQIINHYKEVYHQWYRDARWLNKHLLFNEPCRETSPYIIAAYGYCSITCLAFLPTDLTFAIFG